MVMKALKERRSIRRYGDRTVEDEKLQAVLEAARLAPSWANMQCWTFIVIKDKALKESLAGALSKNPASKAIAGAPVVIAVCADPDSSGRRDGLEYFMLDIGICFQQLMLEAWNQGLGTCWVGWFEEDKAKEVLGVPENIRLVAMTPLGYPAVYPDATPRKPLEEIVFRERWGEKGS